jgi:hypothetical protein
MFRLAALLGLLLANSYANAACMSTGDQDTINSAFKQGGAGAQVQLCPNTTIRIIESIQFTADNQEISTEGYPTGDTRATIQIKPGSTFTTLISGGSRNGIRILNIQVDGNRPNAGYQQGGSHPVKPLRKVSTKAN